MVSYTRYSTVKSNVLSNSLRIDILTVLSLRLNTSGHWVNPVDFASSSPGP